MSITKAWLSERERGGAVLSIRSEEPREHMPITPIIHQMPIRGDIVTTLGVLDDEELAIIRDAINEYLATA